MKVAEACSDEHWSVRTFFARLAKGDRSGGKFPGITIDQKEMAVYYLISYDEERKQKNTMAKERGRNSQHPQGKGPKDCIGEEPR